MHRRGEGPLHFKNYENYRKYLAEIHIHGQSKGHHRRVFIAGREHHVCHVCGSHEHVTMMHRKMYKGHNGLDMVVDHPTYFEAGENNERERVTITPMKKSKPKGYGSREPYGSLNLSQDPSMFLASEQKKVTGKIIGDYSLKFEF